MISGLRSMTGVAALALASQAERPRPFLAQTETPWNLLSSRAAAAIFGLGAVGEYVGDKLPLTPGRLEPLPLGGRVAFGALTGAASCKAAGQSPIVGAALGAFGAVGGAAAGFALRTIVAPRLGLPDFPVALLEDGLTVAAAYGLVRGALQQ
jgi:uncharacterized membrane protein